METSLGWGEGGWAGSLGGWEENESLSLWRAEDLFRRVVGVEPKKVDQSHCEVP